VDQLGSRPREASPEHGVREPLVSRSPYGAGMALRRLASSPARPGRQRPRLAVPLAVVLVAAGIVAVLVSSGPARDAGPPSSPSAESWNSSDRVYVLAMLWHQQQALELASLVEGRTSRPELRRLALSIRTTQTSDVDQMTAWLRARDSAAGDYLVHSDTQPSDRWFAGMMARSQLRTLAATSGQRFDFLFVDMVLEHYKGAIVMADGVLVDGRDAEVALLASRTIADSQRTIRQLSGWRRRWAEPFLRGLTSPAAQSMPASS
jgi:uncharacterized protein (DUF305 family)